MYIPADILLIFCFFFFAGSIGMIIHYRIQAKEYYKMYSEKNELCRSLSDELTKYKKNETLKKF